MRRCPVIFFCLLFDSSRYCFQGILTTYVWRIDRYELAAFIHFYPFSLLLPCSPAGFISSYDFKAYRSVHFVFFSKLGVRKSLRFHRKPDFARAVVIPNLCEQTRDIGITKILWGSVSNERFDFAPCVAKEFFWIAPIFKPALWDTRGGRCTGHRYGLHFAVSLEIVL